MNKIVNIIVHCSDSPDSLDIGVKEIRAWHTAPVPKGRGWREIGYHYVVRLTGAVENGRFENGDPFLVASEVGAHVAGHNRGTLAVCRVGRLEAAMPLAQRAALVGLLAALCRRLGLPATAVLGHAEVAPESGKTCPNLDMHNLRRDVAAQLQKGTT